MLPIQAGSQVGKVQTIHNLEWMTLWVFQLFRASMQVSCIPHRRFYSGGRNPRRTLLIDASWVGRASSLPPSSWSLVKTCNTWYWTISTNAFEWENLWQSVDWCCWEHLTTSFPFPRLYRWWCGTVPWVRLTEVLSFLPSVPCPLPNLQTFGAGIVQLPLSNVRLGTCLLIPLQSVPFAKSIAKATPMIVVIATEFSLLR